MSGLSIFRGAAPRAPRPGGELAAALRACRRPIIGVAVISAVINVLYLTGSIFMLEVYDRVLPSRSVPTLVALVLIAALLYLFQGVFDVIRGRVLVRVGASIQESLSGRVYDAVLRQPLKTRAGGDGLQPLRDLDQVRSFLSGNGPLALLDMPWMPLYLGICFLFSVWIGLAALTGAVLLVTLTLITELQSRAPTRQASGLTVVRNALAESGRRNTEAIHAMGMRQPLAATWSGVNDAYLASQRSVSDVTGGFGAASKVLRMAVQSAVLGTGAYLVIQQEATAGIIIASSILTSRALAPVELAIANWKGFVAARQSRARLTELLAKMPAQEQPLRLPRPEKSVSVEAVSVVPPGGQRAAVQDVSFTLQAGQALGIIGPSASGKSSLARALVGVWSPARGKVRLDGAALESWAGDELGRHIGYLPQDVELFAGTVAQNIARFEKDPEPAAIIVAAQTAGVHELILRLPDGYETQIGEGGTALSAGQRQRIALARAVYGRPFLVVLDEPNSNLDIEGEQALARAIHELRAIGSIVVVVAHRPSALASTDQVLVMRDGRRQSFGPKDEALAKATRPVPLAAIPQRG
jgi:PrtD family type I secretion system ABC transporter